jgi:tetratricopeptide (TPR) repeat protein
LGNYTAPFVKKPRRYTVGVKIAVLPFNTTEGTRPALGRQFANFASEIVRASSGIEVNTVNYLAQIDQDGEQRAAFVNVADTLVEREFIAPLFEQADVDLVMDGLLDQKEDKFTMTQRIHARDTEAAVFETTYEFDSIDLLKTLKSVIENLSKTAGVDAPKDIDFGTDVPQSFISFVEGYDALQYIQQANGLVAREFSPDPAYESLLKALELDKDFLGPYETLCALARLCGQYRLGTFDAAEAALQKISTMLPDDFKAPYALGELFQGVNLGNKASEAYEKSLNLHEAGREAATKDGSLEEWLLEKASIYSRLGIAQMSMGMPVNAELNFKKAIDLEGPEKPSLQMLASVLQQTGRAHEIPALWKTQLDKFPDSPQLIVAYAVSLANADRIDEAVKLFESALERLKDDELLFVKRYYAPLLVNQEDLDRAMDFYEDCIDTAPNDIPLLMEYAQTLKAADREFEVPAILDSILASNPDPNVRAETLAWKTEITEPKRAEAVRSAEEKASNGDFDGAVRELRPLRNWLADYWKLWAVLAGAHNRLEQPEEAKEAAERLINLYPGCEPGYAEFMAALTSLGQFEEAYNLMRFAASNMPHSLGIHINLALAAKRAGHSDEAKALSKQLREAIGPNPELDPVFAELEA